MNIDWILPFGLAFGMVAYGMLVWRFLLPLLGNVEKEAVLAWLAIPHMFRYIGLAFLVPGVTAAALDSRFALPAAFGDLLAACFAMLTVALLASRRPVGMATAWAFNVIGALDLIMAVGLGLAYTPDQALGTAYLIPFMLVPGLLVTHAVSFQLLLSPYKATEGLIQQAHG